MSSVVSKAHALTEKASNVAMYGGAGMATVTISEWCQIIGVILAIDKCVLGIKILSFN